VLPPRQELPLPLLPPSAARAWSVLLERRLPERLPA
jgi:hypothetical protein